MKFARMISLLMLLMVLVLLGFTSSALAGDCGAACRSRGRIVEVRRERTVERNGQGRLRVFRRVSRSHCCN